VAIRRRVGGWDGASRAGFAHTVLVDMRERLRRSQRPDRIFEVALAAAVQAGLLGRRRVLDSTPLYDAVATMDTITLIRSAIRGLLTAAGRGLATELRAVLSSGDDYSSTGKPVVDWDDKTAREALIDSRAHDGYALLGALDGRKDLPEPVTQAMRLLATVLGQDLRRTLARIWSVHPDSQPHPHHVKTTESRHTSRPRAIGGGVANSLWIQVQDQTLLWRPEFSQAMTCWTGRPF
jgi:hypothetical protein